ncbi:metallophosphoesterase [Moheibacter lacus]|uniref:Metallophosphoesterase n=1 Tax=Moheibacter lacus TaxID=2745851 RepID=A0A838ZR72_9FLAO|nr:metallophosphoesterase [Moheibacter lacus]MBA5628643.1 metallophosphoesterase [Moheibacter lacus]
MNRRNFIKKSFLGTIGLGVVGGIYSWQIEPFWVEFIKKKMPVVNLPENLIGKTMMQFSDLHIGDRFDYNFIIESFEKAKAFAPDFVVYTGDFVNYESPEQLDQLEEVLPYFVKGKLGTIGVLGNHDYGKNWLENEVADEIATQLESIGIQILRNEKTEVSGLDIIGIDDYWSMKFDAEKAMRNYDSRAATVVLCHNPDVCDLTIWNNYRGWILSGHTHGGQVKAPFLPPFLLPVKNRRYSAGEIDLEDGRTLYINRALGHLHQIRFNVRPEITVFTLEQKIL